MSWIAEVPEDAAEGRLAECYARINYTNRVSEGLGVEPESAR